MRSRFLRAAVVLATFVVVWLVVTPAEAAAPRCDPRGAITFAPPPQLQEPDSSLDIDVDYCGAFTPLESKEIAPGQHVPLGAESAMDASFAMTSTLPALDPPAVRVHGPPHGESAPRAGLRITIERPPRA